MTARRLIVCLCTLLVVALLMPGRALAHAHLVRADLAPDGHLLVRADTYRFWFDESLNPSLSRIIIRDTQGRQVNADTGRLNPSNGQELDVVLPALPNGQYTVLWTSDSQQDGHILHGFYLFTVGGAGAVVPSASTASIAAPDTPALDTTALAVALAHWLVLAASALWTGALALDVLVLAPARRPGEKVLADVAGAASGACLVLARLGLLATLVTSLIELGAQAYAAGGWGGLTSETVVGDILNSHYGSYWVLRMLLSFLALLLLGGSFVRALGPAAAGKSLMPGRPTTALRSIGLGPLQAWLATVCGLAYLLAIALSGHAAAVPELLLTSVLLDWLHLLAMAIWIGGMAAIAVVLVPILLRPSADRHLPVDGRASVLDLLDRYSPWAFLALATAAATGMFNTQVHLSSFDQFTGTAYGRFLLIKLALIAEISLLSASHVFLTRPQLRRQSDSAVLQEGYASLAIRLRVEPLIGALILLCVALMGQVAPSITLFNQSTQSAPPSPVPAPSPPAVAERISGAATTGALTVSLQVASPAVGRARFIVAVHEHGTLVTGDSGQVRIRLSFPTNATLGRVYVETSPGKGGYSGTGDLVQEGAWQADVLVRTRSDPGEYREVPFIFLVGPGARFISVPPVDHQYGPATVSLTQPQAAPDIMTVTLRPGLIVRYEINMPGMPGMGLGDYDAKASGQGRYSGLVQFPMAGITNIAIQVQRAGQWRLVRLLVYTVDDNFVAHLLTP